MEHSSLYVWLQIPNMIITAQTQWPSSWTDLYWIVQLYKIMKTDKFCPTCHNQIQPALAWPMWLIAAFPNATILCTLSRLLTYSSPVRVWKRLSTFQWPGVECAGVLAAPKPEIVTTVGSKNTTYSRPALSSTLYLETLSCMKNSINYSLSKTRRRKFDREISSAIGFEQDSGWCRRPLWSLSVFMRRELVRLDKEKEEMTYAGPEGGRPFGRERSRNLHPV